MSEIEEAVEGPLLSDDADDVDDAHNDDDGGGGCSGGAFSAATRVVERTVTMVLVGTRKDNVSKPSDHARISDIIDRTFIYLYHSLT